MLAPDLSILIPTCNEERWIGHCLRSLRASLRTCEVTGEILVCDGGSEDRTTSIARRIGVDAVVTTDVRRRAVQLNRGAHRARGDVLVFLHADTLVEPRWIRALVDAMRGPSLGGWSSIEILPERSGLGSRWGLAWIARGINVRTRLFETATGDQGIFMRRDIFEKLGGYPELSIMEGYLLMARLRRMGPVTILDPPIRISGRRWEEGGLLRTTLVMYAIRLGFILGVDPDRLAEWWHRWTETPDH